MLHASTGGVAAKCAAVVSAVADGVSGPGSGTSCGVGAGCRVTSDPMFTHFFGLWCNDVPTRCSAEFPSGTGIRVRACM